MLAFRQHAIDLKRSPLSDLSVPKALGLGSALTKGQALVGEFSRPEYTDVICGAEYSAYGSLPNRTGKLVGQARADSGLLTPRILEPGKAEPEQHRAIITPHEILVRRRPGYVRPAVPHWIPGLFMLFRSEAYRQIGGFDERFFMYGEDFDICARLRLAGWKLSIAEHLQTRHDAQRASHSSKRHLYWHLTSLLKVWSSAAFWRYRRLDAASRPGAR